MAPVNEQRLVFLNGEYIASVDTHDSHGVQRYVATTLTELVEKLITAQENATRMINKLHRQNKEYEAKAARRVRLVRTPGAR